MVSKRATDPRRSRQVERETLLRRRAPSRVGWSTAVVTNGKCTERQYFDGIKTLPWITSTTVRVFFEHGTPHDVVKRADKLRRDEGYDEVWAVCDVDEYDVGSAIRAAERSKIGIVLSNPCFEVWLSLHLADCGKYFENATQVEQRLKQLLPTWDKTKLLIADFHDGIGDADKRAQRLDPPPIGNPSTDVWRVIAALSKTH